MRLTMSRSYWIMQRTPDTFPSYINDVGQSMMEYVSELTRERVRYRANGYQPVFNITSPNGSNDAFYIKIDQHYGSSDHVTYMQYGIPAVMFITWPDMWYHSSQDTPDKQDSTQYKRAAVVATGALAVDRDRRRSDGRPRDERKPGARHRAHGRRAAEGRRLPRRRDDVGRAAPAWKEARVAIKHQADVEKAVVRSSGVLYADAAGAPKRLAPIEAAIDRKRGRVDRLGAKALYALHAQRLNTAPVYEPPQTAEEKEAANLLVECAGQATFSGCAFAQGARGAAGAPGAAGAGGGGRRRRWRTRRFRRSGRAGAAAAHERRALHPARQEAHARSRFATSCPENSSPCRWPTSWPCCARARPLGRIKLVPRAPRRKPKA